MKKQDDELGERAKRTLENFVAEIGPKFEKYFEEELARRSGFNVREKQLVEHMLGHIKEYLLRPQKRLRPSFVYYGYLLGQKGPASANNSPTQIALASDSPTQTASANEGVWRAAMGVEVVHASILMHDDFMDSDAVRRGGPTTHKYYERFMNGGSHYGEAMAVSVGDAGWSLGYELLAKCGLPPKRVLNALTHFFRTVVDTAYGQAFDVSLPLYDKWTEEDVLAVHKAKTAMYTYQNPLFVGAYLAGLSQEAFSILHDYAMDGGVAFQLQDDILGVFGEPAKTGKSADSDLLQGKCTLLILKALDDTDAGGKEAIERVWGKGSASKEDIDIAKQVIRDSGSLEYSRDLAKKLAKSAAVHAAKLRDLNLNTEAIDYIQGVAEYMTIREV